GAQLVPAALGAQQGDPAGCLAFGVFAVASAVRAEPLLAAGEDLVDGLALACGAQVGEAHVSRTAWTLMMRAPAHSSWIRASSAFALERRGGMSVDLTVQHAERRPSL